MEKSAQARARVPRIVPTARWIQAVQGVWEMGGEEFRLAREPETGVLRAVDRKGNEVNPLRIISRGSKVRD